MCGTPYTLYKLFILKAGKKAWEFKILLMRHTRLLHAPHSQWKLTPVQSTFRHTSFALETQRTGLFPMSDTNVPSQVQAVPTDLADAAAKDLEHCVEPKRLEEEPKNPWLYPPPGRALTQKVTDAWFKVSVALRLWSWSLNLISNDFIEPPKHRTGRSMFWKEISIR